METVIVKKTIIEVLTLFGKYYFTGDEDLGDVITIKDRTPMGQSLRFNCDDAQLEYDASEYVGYHDWKPYFDQDTIKNITIIYDMEVEVTKHKVTHCCLSALLDDISIDLPADAIDASEIIYYHVEWTHELHKDSSIYRAVAVEQVPYEDKHAFPVYELTECVDQFGEWTDEDMHIIGWCVRKDPFLDLPGVIYY